MDNQKMNKFKDQNNIKLMNWKRDINPNNLKELFLLILLAIKNKLIR